MVISVHMHIEGHSGILLHCVQAEVANTNSVSQVPSEARLATLLQKTQHSTDSTGNHMRMTGQQPPLLRSINGTKLDSTAQVRHPADSTAQKNGRIPRQPQSYMNREQHCSPSSAEHTAHSHALRLLSCQPNIQLIITATAQHCRQQ
jgi:hypothetical protein